MTSDKPSRSHGPGDPMDKGDRESTYRTDEERRTRRPAATGSPRAARKAKARRPEPDAPDAIALLQEDHAHVRELLRTLVEEPDTRKRTFDEVELELLVHARLEEEMFYPAFKDHLHDAEDRRIYFEAVQEHNAVERLLEEMVDENPASETFDAQCVLLERLVLDHAEEEERTMLPLARRIIPREELARLAEDLQQRREELRAGGAEALRRHKVSPRALSMWHRMMHRRGHPRPHRHGSDHGGHGDHDDGDRRHGDAPKDEEAPR